MESALPNFVSVVLDQNLKKPLDYIVPAIWQAEIKVGMRVEVPLRKGTVVATVIALKQTSNIPKLKEMIKPISQSQSLSKPLWALCLWMASYYCAPIQKTLKCFIPPSIRKEILEKKEFFFKLNLSKEKAVELTLNLRNKNSAQAAILDKLLQEPAGVSAKKLCEELHISKSPIDTLLKNKWITKIEKKTLDVSEIDFFPSAPKTLNEEQKQCLEKINDSITKGHFAAHLIQGVTGSGKTEVYLQAIQTALNLGKSAIMLVPEVALTSQTIERFRSRFQEKIAIWHHRRSHGQKKGAWEDLYSGKARIVIGARSAVFCPLQNLGLIIVDEEHDGSYKQSEEAPCYHARDVAVMRAHLEKATVILGSATPSMESKYNTEIGKYTLHRLSVRATKANIPKIQIVDMKRAFEITGGFTHFSEELIRALKLRIEEGEQAMLFLNRRGYHRLQICASCKTTVTCPHCDLGLTFHKNSDCLRCHLCSFEQKVSKQCSSCGSYETLEFKGFGTEHVERSLHALMPGIRTLRMDKDTTQKKSSHEDLYKQFRAHKADVLIGTQMIAKGFHFPSVTLVCILNADAMLCIPDFKAAENAFQLITQVAGRSGRSELPGEVILQTFLPEHPTIQLAAKQDFDAFYAKEIEERRLFGFPPFCHLIKVTFTGKTPETTEEAAKFAHAELSINLPQGCELMPVIAAAHAKVKDQYRYQFVIKALKVSLLQNKLQNLTSSCAFKIDIDTLNTFF